MQRKHPWSLKESTIPLNFQSYTSRVRTCFFLNRLDVEKYDTAIERGIYGIEHIMRWNVSNGIAPQASVLKMTFGLGNVTISEFGENNAIDRIVIAGKTKERDENGNDDQKYPWMNIIIGCARERIIDFYAKNPINNKKMKPDVHPT